jgi:hypothetical protein
LAVVAIVVVVVVVVVLPDGGGSLELVELEAEPEVVLLTWAVGELEEDDSSGLVETWTLPVDDDDGEVLLFISDMNMTFAESSEYEE